MGRDVGGDDGPAARHRLEHREPETLVDRGGHDDCGVAVQRVELAVRHAAEQVDARLVERGDGVGRHPADGSRDRQRDVDAARPQLADRGDHDVVRLSRLDRPGDQDVGTGQAEGIDGTARQGRVRLSERSGSERNVVHAIGIEALADELVAREARRRDDRGGFLAGDREPAFVEPDPVARERLRVTQERDVVDRDDERRGGRGHRQARRVAHVEAEADPRSPGAVPQLVPAALREQREAPELDPRTESGREAPTLGAGAGGERHDVGVARELGAQELGHPADATGHRLQQLAHVHADAQPAAVTASRRHERPRHHKELTLGKRAKLPLGALSSLTRTDGPAAGVSPSRPVTGDR